MTPSRSPTDPLAPELTLAALDEVLCRCVRPVPDLEGWVEVLLDELPPDWRMAVSADVARAGLLTPESRAVLLRTRWEARARLLRTQARVALDFRDTLLRGERGPSEEELAQAPTSSTGAQRSWSGMGPPASWMGAPGPA